MESIGPFAALSKTQNRINGTIICFNNPDIIPQIIFYF